MRKMPGFLLALLFFLPLAACASPRAPEPVTLQVFAAASLTNAYQAMAEDFEAANPGVTVNLNLAGSQVLARQIADGAPVDVFASADRRQMDAAIASGRVQEAQAVLFARNRMAVFLAPGNPGSISSLADLARPGLRLLLAADAVPAGQYARQVLASAESDPAYGPGFSAAVLANVVSYEENVRTVVGKVRLGEADAGIAFATDGEGGEPALEQVSIPEAINVSGEYWIAPIRDSQQAPLAEAFVAYLLSDQGQARIGEFGFLPARESPAAP